MSNDSTTVPVPSRVLRRLYLTLFLRGRSSRGLKTRGPQSIGAKLWLTLVFYGLAGCLGLTMLGQSLFSLSLYLHGAALFFIGMFVASSAGEVLFNKEEAEILLHRPVEPRAMLWAKVAVLLQVSLWLAFAFNLAVLIGASLVGRIGILFVPAHLISATVSAFFCTGAVVLIYQLCLRWFGRERLDGLMTLAQVLMTMVLVLGGQIAPQLARHLPAEVRLSAETWWLVLLPPAWFAGLDETLMGRGTPTSWALAGAGVGVTAFVLIAAFGKLAATYGSGLRALGESSATPPAKSGKPRTLQRLASLPLLSWWLRHPLERSGFLLVGAHMLRDRDVKLRLYPGVAPMILMPVVMMLTTWRSGPSDAGHPMLMVFGGYVAMVPMMAMNLLQYSQSWQAADVFQITPTTGPGRLIIGARKAVGVFLVFPALLVLMTGAFFVSDGNPASIAALLPGMIALPVYARIGGFSMKGVPLSQPVEDAKDAKRGLIVFFASISVFALGGLAAVAQSFGYYPAFLVLEGLLVIGICWLMDLRTRSLRWPGIEDGGGTLPPASWE